MKLLFDHLAFRVKDRHQAAEFFVHALHYSIVEEFDLPFPDGSKARSLALSPPKNVIAPEIFISDGEPGSIVGDWVEKNGPGLHHVAIATDHVEDQMEAWMELELAEFTSNPLTCPDQSMTQVFTKPMSETLGVVFELIHRRDKESKGFCAANVIKLMESSVDKS